MNGIWGSGTKRCPASSSFLLLTTALWICAAQPDADPTLAGGATNASPVRLTLAEAQRVAFARNWDLLAAQSGVELAVAQKIVTKEFPNPSLSLSTAKIGTHDNATLLGNDVWRRSYDTIAAVGQLIEIGGKRRHRQASAQAGIVSARARLFEAKRLLEQGVTKAYVAALFAQDNAQILRDSARSLRHEADIAQTRFRAGDISESDLRQIENNAATFELQAQAAQAAAVQARIGVEILMGVAQPKGQWQPADALDRLTLAPPPARPMTAGAARPDVLAAEAELQRAETDLKLQKALRVPDPTISVLYEHSPNQPSPPPASDTMGLGVSFPLPLWNRNRGNIRAALATREQAALALAKVKAQAAADVANAEVAFGEASARLQRYQDELRPKARKVREAVAYAYQKGGASLVDLLTAERDDNNVRLATAQAMSDAANAAADLTAARNVLAPTELQNKK